MNIFGATSTGRTAPSQSSNSITSAYLIYSGLYTCLDTLYACNTQSLSFSLKPGANAVGAISLSSLET